MRYAGSYLEPANFFMDDPLPLYSLNLTINEKTLLWNDLIPNELINQLS
jgi:hypothetical protein